MDYGRILRRSLDITWRYRALWVFGIALALFAGYSGGGGGGSSNATYSGNGEAFGGLPGLSGLSGADWAAIAVVIGLVALGVLLLAVVFAVAGAILRYVSTTALIRMVDSTEDTGEKLRWTQGFRLGWSWRSVRLFLIDLVVGLATFVVFSVLFVLALLPLLMWATGDTTAGILGTVATIGLVVLVIMLALLVALAYSLVRPFVQRMAVLRDLGVFQSIKQGCAALWAHFSKAGTMWLIMVGIRIAYGIGMLIALLVLLMVALVAGGVPAALTYFVASALLGDAAGVVMAAVIGIPIFLLVVAVPSLFVGGLWEVYHSTVWTLTFRELLGPAPALNGAVVLPEPPVEPL